MDSRQKMYVDSKEIQIRENKIMLKTPQGLLSLKALHRDKNGFYIIKSSLKGVRAKSMVYCPNCGQMVDSEDMHWHRLFYCPGTRRK